MQSPSNQSAGVRGRARLSVKAEVQIRFGAWKKGLDLSTSGYAGHCIPFSGKLTMAFRPNEKSLRIGFENEIQ